MRRKEWEKKKQPCRKAGTLYKGHGLRPCQKSLDFLLQCGHTSEALPAGLSHSDRMTCVIYQRGQSLGKLIWQSLGEFIPPYPQHTHTHAHIIHLSRSFTRSHTHTIPSHLFGARLLPKNGSVIFLSSTHQLAVLFPFLSFALFQNFHCYSSQKLFCSSNSSSA